ncbi:MAG: hypothetical protein NTY95_14200, partial [Bacteroidia bacterium]|nr:hypothetical protein [Bacteroidia bacterium]
MLKSASKIRNYFILTLTVLITGSQVLAQRQMENLDRGLIAIRTEGDSVYIGWRMMGTEPDEIAFNIYRQSRNEKPAKLNKKPIVESTNYVDGSVNLLTENTYYIRAV